MRSACLLAQLARQGYPVDRSGTGKVVEVCSAASLKMWGLPYRNYKGPGNSKALQELISTLQYAAPWLDFDDTPWVWRPDVVDAVIAALTARAAHRSLTLLPRNPHEAAAASTEGWTAIPLPGSQLSELPQETNP